MTRLLETKWSDRPLHSRLQGPRGSAGVAHPEKVGAHITRARSLGGEAKALMGQARKLKQGLKAGGVERNRAHVVKAQIQSKAQAARRLQKAALRG